MAAQQQHTQPEADSAAGEAEREYSPLERLWLAISLKGKTPRKSVLEKSKSDEDAGTSTGGKETHPSRSSINEESLQSHRHDPITFRSQVDSGSEFTLVDVAAGRGSASSANGSNDKQSKEDTATVIEVPSSPDEEFTQKCLKYLKSSPLGDLERALSNPRISMSEIIRYHAESSGWFSWRRQGHVNPSVILINHIYYVADALSFHGKQNVLVGVHYRYGKGIKDDATVRSLVEKIFTSTFGQELMELKNIIDHGADSYDLEHLIFRCLDDGGRDEILKHFGNEAQKLYLPSHDPSLRLQGSTEMCRPHGQYLDDLAKRVKGLEDDGSTLYLQPNKILSDIDDTFHASLKDRSFPWGRRYPGVRAFYEALKEGHPGQVAGQLVFVTARPRIAKMYTHSALREYGTGDITVLTGNFRNFLTHSSMAEKKAENFQKYAELFPETHLIFVGDSGQGDISAIKTAIASLRKAQRNVPHVFIHDVIADKNSQQKYLGSGQRWNLALEGVYVFDSYVDAALLALQLGLITPEHACMVQQDAYEELLELFPEEAASINFVGKLVTSAATEYVRSTGRASSIQEDTASRRTKLRKEPWSDICIRIPSTLVAHMRQEPISLSHLAYDDGSRESTYSELGFGLYSGEGGCIVEDTGTWRERRKKKRIMEFSVASQRLLRYLNAVYESCYS
eukprot:gb/GECG01002217.1/.p1 GENE.gb/GECG01002217.1/~~gb/GECG01002217.1/.p1  ORF type:complete len:680 (+),score=90.14 gb/GECG01002217.1/:1-2040(+)